jgi:hypothetical protein
MWSGATTFTIMTFSIKTLCKLGLIATLSKNDSHHFDMLSEIYFYDYAEHRIFINIVLSVIRLNNVMVSIVGPLGPMGPMGPLGHWSQCYKHSRA